MKVAVTGAFSYSGKYIARRLLNRGDTVAALTNHPHREHDLGSGVELYPLDLEDFRGLQASLTGCDVLVNTYWIRFNRGNTTHARAVQNSEHLMRAAAAAGVRRVVHLSITNPTLQSSLSYFRGKAETERILQESGLSYAILRPTVLFGAEDILINNMAWLLRRFPFVLIAGSGSYELQPVYVDDLAEMVEQVSAARENLVWDAVGPERYTFRELLTLIGDTIGYRRPLISTSPGNVVLAAKALGLALRDVLLTADELKGLMASLLVSSEPARCASRLSDWLNMNRESLGRRYASELRRHYA